MKGIDMKGTEMKPTKTTSSSRPVAAAAATVQSDKIGDMSGIATRMQQLSASIEELAATRRRLGDKLQTAMVPMPAEARDPAALDSSSASPLALTLYDFECKVDEEIWQLRYILECVDL